MNQNNSLNKRILIKPFIYKRESLGFESIKILILLLVQVFMLFVTKTYNSVILILVSVLASSLSDIFVAKVFNQKQHFSLYVALIQGILIGMLIPGTFSPVTVFFCVFLSMFICKYAFGGFSFTWINPVIFNVLVLWFVNSASFPQLLVTKDILMMRNPCLLLIENGTFPILPFDTQITDFINSQIFNIFKVSIPEGYVSLFLDSASIIPAFRFNFLTLISSIFIFSADLNKAIVPFSFLAVYLLLVRLVSPIVTECYPMQGDMILSLLTSGTLFFAVFVINSYGTHPISTYGKIAYGVILGLLAFLIVGCGTSSIGMIFTVLIADIFSLLIQWHEENLNRKKVSKLVKAFESEE